MIALPENAGGINNNRLIITWTDRPTDGQTFTCICVYGRVLREEERSNGLKLLSNVRSVVGQQPTN